MQIYDPETAVRPFVKWVGGKRRSLPVLMSYMPEHIDTYVEPFVGGGAMLFALKFKKAVISDLNPELICAYKAIRDDLEGLKKLLQTFKYDKEQFLEVRAWDRDNNFLENRTETERGARLIYLLKTCFNGLYRVSGKGYFNTPFGKLDNPNICDVPTLERAHAFLNEKQVEILNLDYNEVLRRGYITKDAVVYLDPPYAPLNRTSYFTSYAIGDFTDCDQTMLRDYCDVLNANGIRFLESNSTAPIIFDLYRKYAIPTLNARRSINSKGTGRGAIKELVIRNYAD